MIFSRNLVRAIDDMGGWFPEQSEPRDGTTLYYEYLIPTEMEGYTFLA